MVDEPNALVTVARGGDEISSDNVLVERMISTVVFRGARDNQLIFAREDAPNAKVIPPVLGGGRAGTRPIVKLDEE